jgi:hypothetical protein
VEFLVFFTGKAVVCEESGSTDVLVKYLCKTLGRKIVDVAVAGACSMYESSERYI